MEEILVGTRKLFYGVLLTFTLQPQWCVNHSKSLCFFFSLGAAASIYHVNVFSYILTYNIMCGSLRYGINISQVDLPQPFSFYYVFSWMSSVFY